jgi:membrane protease YdiL (CAAX protease family)
MEWHAGAVTTTATEQAVEAPPRFSWNLVPAVLVSLSAFLMFGLQRELVAYPVLAAGIGVGFLLDRDLGRSLLLIGLGITPIGLISVAADIRWSHYFLVAGVLTVAVLTPYLLDRFVFKRHVIRFPLRSGRKWTVKERIYLVSVPALAYLIMPFYFINSGTYQNWPAPREPSELARLFVGVNAVGLWDELFFICTVFTLLRRHFPIWQANLLQAVIFVSFLWELGYTSWGPFLTFPFALVQGYLFARTRSLPYVLCTHLIFDCVLWLILVYAHNPGWLPKIFLY